MNFVHIHGNQRENVCYQASFFLALLMLEYAEYVQCNVALNQN